MREYDEYIVRQAQHNPCLAYLRNFLCDGSGTSYPSRFASLSFYSDRDVPILEKPAVGTSIEPYLERPRTTELQGRIILLEDPHREAIRQVGQRFDVDPLFFASHIHAPWRDMNSKTPEMAILPSRLRPREFVNLYYHRSFLMKSASESVRKLMPKSNIHRKVMVLPAGSHASSRNGGRLALAQQCCSVVKLRLTDETWLCLILLDRPVTNTCFPVKGLRHETHPVEVLFQPFLGGYEDFQDPPPFSRFSEQDNSLTRESLFDDLLYYWIRECPASFNPSNPGLTSLSYFPMKIVAEEWMIYLTVMRQTIKEYEYSLEDLDASSTLTQELERLKSDLASLQSWRRRILSTRQKTRAVLRFLGAHADDIGRHRSLAALEADYGHLAAEVQEYGGRLEGILPVVTSMVQIVDSRRALAETASVTRLTYLAVVFVPLTFTSGLFSMSDDLAPGGSLFWLYFVVAVPLTLVIFLVARPPAPVRALRDRWERLKRWLVRARWVA